MSKPAEDHHTVLESKVTPAPGALRDFAEDKEPEPVVTRKELWSYYRMPSRVPSI